jgi:RNA polymerase sigma factor (sigma-70 family)
MFGVRRIERDVEARELARWAVQGRRVAQRDLFRRLASPVHDTLYHVLGSNDQMEGLLEDAFVEIFRSLAAYDHKLDLDTWACATAIRVVYRHLRGGQRDSRPVVERASRVECVGAPESDASRASIRQVYGLLRSLEPEHHVTLALFMMGRRSVSEIAALTDVNTVVVRERIVLAKRLLWAAARGDSGLMASISRHTLAD